MFGLLKSTNTLRAGTTGGAMPLVTMALSASVSVLGDRKMLMYPFGAADAD